LDWTGGNGAGRLVLISSVENMDLPVDGESYTSNPTYGASALGASTHTFVIGNGAISTTDVTDLAYGTAYYISIIEFTEPTPGNFLYDRQSAYSETYFTVMLIQLIDYADTPPQTYGDDDFTLAATATSGLPVTFSYVSGPGSVNGNSVTITGAGDIVVEYHVVGDATFSEATVQVTIPIAKAALTATADDDSRSYGIENSTLGITYSDFVNGESESVLDLAPVTSTQADATSNVGSYDIILSIGNDNNYEISHVDGTLIVTKAALTANVESESKTYGEINPGFTFSYSGFENEDDESVIDTPPTISTSADETSDVGSFAISASGGIDDNYDIISNDGILTINKATLSAAINDQERPFGEQNTEVTFSYTGFENNDTEAVIDVPPFTSTNASSISNVGSYAITALNSGSDNNYSISLPVDGTLTITKADQTISLDAIADQDYSISDQVAVISSVNSNLQVVLAVTGPATINGNIITLDATEGAVVVTATQLGDSNHNAAPEETTSFSAFASDACFNFEVALVGSVSTTCNGSSDGSIDIAVAGGDGNYTYSWSNGLETEDLNNLIAGTYTLTATDGNSCSASVSETIQEPAPIEISVTITDAVSGNDGGADITVTGGTNSGYSFSWSDGSTSEDLVNVAAGNYTVTVTDANGCTVTQTFAIGGVTGIGDEWPSSLKIYPNPAINAINIDLQKIQDTEIKLLSLDGRIAKDFGIQGGDRIRLDLADLRSGIYLLQVVYDDQRHLQKVIIK